MKMMGSGMKTKIQAVHESRADHKLVSSWNMFALREKAANLFIGALSVVTHALGLQ